jgi:hypothetical protein
VALNRIDISGIRGVSFTSPGENPIHSGESKNTFAPGELEPFYDMISPVIRSQYGQAALTKGTTMMKKFVKK